jgi:hypothetical protein
MSTAYSRLLLLEKAKFIEEVSTTDPNAVSERVEISVSSPLL